ncbi:MAG: hypothetical protein ABJG88_10540 [Litorimonas sp.]
MVKRIGLITGIKLEDNLLRKGFKQAGCSDILTACAAGRVEGAQDAALKIITQGATHLISFGVCGGLSPYVKAGDLILADSVTMDGDVLQLTHNWHKVAFANFPNARAGKMLSVAMPITTPQDKHNAHEATGAVAVDVESFAVAQIAAAHKLPCIIIRAVLDNATQSLPKAAMSGVDDTGQTRVWPVIAALLKRPQDLPALLNLARDSGLAQDTLKVVTKKGAPNFWAP